jgi:hypothetical protein
MKELFEKVYIRSEKDLPKKNGTYFIKIKTPPFTQELSAVGFIWEKDTKNVHGFWLEAVDWYLLPVESKEIDINTPFFGNSGATVPVESNEVSDEDIEKAAKEFQQDTSTSFNQGMYTGYIFGAIAMKNGKIKKQ